MLKKLTIEKDLLPRGPALHYHMIERVYSFINIFLLYAAEPLPTGQVHLRLGGRTGPARPHQLGEIGATGREVRAGQKILGG